MRTLTLTALLFLPYFLYSQEWRPITSAEGYNYRIDSAAHITHVVSIDSAAQVSTDSVFYLNRVVKPCPGCPYPGTYLANQPQFLKRRMVAMQDGYYLFSDPGKFLLKTLANPGQSWIFDTAQAITAQVTSVTFEPVLGQVDSVKTILLSNGQIIRLSREHGLVQFPDLGASHFYVLEGIAGRNLGVLLPGYMDIYNFQPGDVFQHEYKWLSYVMGGGVKGFLKHRILARDSTSIGYSYLVEECHMKWDISTSGIPGATSHHYEIKTIDYIDSATSPLNSYPGRLIVDPMQMGDDYMASILSVNPDTGQLIATSIGPQLFFLDHDTLFPSSGFYIYLNKYVTTLGNTASIDNGNEWSSYDYLIGYVKNGDTTGLIHSDPFLLQDLAENSTNAGLKVYPNPAHDRILVPIAKATGRSYAIDIFDRNGRRVMHLNETTRTGVFSIDLQDLPPGFYFLQARTDDFIGHARFIVE